MTDHYEGLEDLGPRVAHARAYLRKHERARRERVRRVAWSLAPLVAFAIMFWRV